MLLDAYQVQIAGHKIRNGILCWLELKSQESAVPNSTSMITSEAAM